MSSARRNSMNKIQAVIDGHAFTIENPDLLTEDEQLDAAVQVTSNQELLEEQRLAQARLKTEADIQRLEEAKRKASSQAVREELENEAKLIRLERLRAEEEEKERQEQMTPEQLAQERVRSVVTGVQKQVDHTVKRVTEVGKDAVDGLARVSTPGSIFLPVSVLVVFFLLLLPVNGRTRFEWLWLTLTGNAQLTGAVQGGGADFGNTTAQGGGADFGTTSFVTTTRIFTGPSEVF